MSHRDYQRIEEAIRFIEKHAVEQPSLDDVAGHLGLSPCHFQRLFKRWAGISPKRFLQYLTVEHARRLLRDSASVLDAAYEVGLSGPGRLHDLFVSVDAVTPGECKSSGVDLRLDYAFHGTPFGDCLIAESARGICHLAFIEADQRAVALEELRRNWQEASLVKNPAAGSQAVRRIFLPAVDEAEAPVKVLLKGTNFQIKVWQALLKIPAGALVSYGALAAAVGHPGASRAVGAAVGRNPVAYLIPCHRVFRSNGEAGGYRWGSVRKKAILGYEAQPRQ